MTRLAPIAELIAEELEKRKRADPSFSLRTFAGRLGLSAATLSQVISGKRSVSRRTAQYFVDRVALSERDARQVQELLVGKTRSAGFDEQGIKDLLRSFTALWNDHDAERMAAAWDQKGCLIEPWGLVLDGRAAILAFYRRAHSTYLKDASIEMQPTSLRFITRGSAFGDIRATIYGMQRPESPTPVTLAMNIPVTFVSRRGGWKFLASRPYLPLPQAFAPWKGGRGRKAI